MTREQQAEEIRNRTGRITATEVLVRRGEPEDKIAEHVLPFVLPHLCSPWGRVMP